ncbi:MAG: hypothetical protein MZV70_54320 [Desulfobacterales bacterium]|nr:hypothetical protein [Desulfobacterales bacterium]
MVSPLRSVIVGAGEIGRALQTVLAAHYTAFLYDILEDGFEAPRDIAFLHICFPYTPHKFEDEVRRYERMFKPTYVIVHSTVPVGTCASLRAIHSPVRGKHHDIVHSLQTYTKFFGGLNADKAANMFLRIGIPVAVCKDSRATELAKILETSFLGLMIRWSQEVDYITDRAGLSYTEVWDKFTSTYNEKAKSMGQPEFPVLVPIQDTIGGHCVLPNLEFLPSSFAFKPLLKGIDHA